MKNFDLFYFMFDDIQIDKLIIYIIGFWYKIALKAVQSNTEVCCKETYMKCLNIYVTVFK